ncbi:MAG: MerR family transcriptional regulator [Tractidigestivibacter sp.]|jgi:DNA-binding transcriptional MerR regulator|uniref:MerR family transcriptional regulator n=1 Tax=Tractidigestivibacter sp. TaxID=2847320 RepID=UPI003D8A07E7
MRENELVKISEMAKIHGISRQTLILYDRMGLFKPSYVSETGYRYYSIDQVPQLREIIFLRDIGVSLSDIAEYMKDRTTERLQDVLSERLAAIDEEMATLERQRTFVKQRQQLHAHVATKSKNVGRPYFEWMEERHAIFEPYPSSHMDERSLHLTLMNAWRHLSKLEMVPSCGFGSLIRTKALSSDEPLSGAGSIIMLPEEVDSKRLHDAGIDDQHFVVLPAGEYVTLYTYEMPYELDSDRWLMSWMTEQGIEPKGDIVDLCLLDLMFHGEGEKDLCQLEVRVG